MRQPRCVPETPTGIDLDDLHFETTRRPRRLRGVNGHPPFITYVGFHSVGRISSRNACKLSSARLAYSRTLPGWSVFRTNEAAQTGECQHDVWFVTLDCLLSLNFLN